MFFMAVKWIPKRLVELSLINVAAATGKLFVDTCEAEYNARIEAAADAVLASGRHLVMLTGPSGSGKTTSSNKIAAALRARGVVAQVISLDDFFLDLDKYPRLPDGSKDGFTLVGSSPETLMRVTDRKVMTFPIGGTRPRPTDPLDDARVIEELKADPKEVREHMMLLDLSKDDLEKVCDPDTIEVFDPMAIKLFSHVIHITSTVIGQLREGMTSADCLAATFPAGTLSGAPKERSVDIIDELEPARRGLYGGVTGYFDFSGNADLAITIRTAIIKDGQASLQAGAGVVAQSDSEYEYNETLDKAGAAIKAIQIASQLAERDFSPNP